MQKEGRNRNKMIKVFENSCPQAGHRPPSDLCTGPVPGASHTCFYINCHCDLSRMENLCWNENGTSRASAQTSFLSNLWNKLFHLSRWRQFKRFHVRCSMYFLSQTEGCGSGGTSFPPWVESGRSKDIYCLLEETGSGTCCWDTSSTTNCCHYATH